MADTADRLSSASARGELAVVEFLLQNGANANAVNAFGRTALQVSTDIYIFGHDPFDR